MNSPEVNPNAVSYDLKRIESDSLAVAKKIEDKLKKINDLEDKLAEQDFYLFDNPKKLKDEDLDILKNNLEELIIEKNKLEAEEDALIQAKRNLLN